MEQMILGAAVSLLAAAAVLVVMTDKLLKAVFYAGVFSLLAAFCFVLLGAPDVALAEAVIGSAVSTVLYLAALRGYKLLTVSIQKGGYGGEKVREALRIVETALRKHELELHIIEAGPEEDHSADFIIREEADKAVIQGLEGSLYVRDIRQRLDSRKHPLNIEVVEAMPPDREVLP